MSMKLLIRYQTENTAELKIAVPLSHIEMAEKLFPGKLKSLFSEFDVDLSVLSDHPGRVKPMELIEIESPGKRLALSIG